jgi:hypothetical protein
VTPNEGDNYCVFTRQPVAVGHVNPGATLQSPRHPVPAGHVSPENTRHPGHAANPGATLSPRHPFSVVGHVTQSPVLNRRNLTSHDEGNLYSRSLSPAIQRRHLFRYSKASTIDSSSGDDDVYSEPYAYLQSTSKGRFCWGQPRGRALSIAVSV